MNPYFAAGNVPPAGSRRSRPRNVGKLLSAPPERDKKAERRRIFKRLRTAQSIMYHHPIGGCTCYARDRQEGVSFVLNGATVGVAGYIHCGNRLCPYCCAKLAYEDAERAKKHIKRWMVRGSWCCMVAFTLRHKADEPLGVTWDALTKALNKLRGGRPWERLEGKWHLGEYMYGREVTDGENGYHPHRHDVWELLNFPNGMSKARCDEMAEQLQAELAPMWIAVLASLGRSASVERGVKVTILPRCEKNAEKAAAYITKAANELAQGGMKSGRKGGKTLFELLDVAGDTTDKSDEGKALRARARARYAEAVFATGRRHWFFCSEPDELPDDGDGEEKVPEKDLDDKGSTLLVVSHRTARLLAERDVICTVCEMLETKSVDVVKDWIVRLQVAAGWALDDLDDENSRYYNGAGPPANDDF